MSTVVTPEVLAQSLDFDVYLDLTKNIIEQESFRTEMYQNDKMLAYTRENLARMNRVLTTINLESKLYNAVSELKEEWLWVIITEPWCGDAAQIVPALHTIASVSEKITCRYVLRDTNQAVINAYLTNGGQAIPKLVCFRKADMTELGTWGPRPVAAQALVDDFKANPNGRTFGDFVRQLHAWYEENKSADVQDELTLLVKTWKENSLK